MSLAGGHFFPAPTTDTPVQRPLDRLDGVPFLQGADYGLQAVAALMRYAAHLRDRRATGQTRLTPKDTASAAHAILERARGSRLSAAQGADTLWAYAIPAARQTVAVRASEALEAAEILGYPVAAKIEA